MTTREDTAVEVELLPLETLCEFVVSSSSWRF